AVRLDAALSQLAVAAWVVADELGQVRADLDAGDGRARNGHGARARAPATSRRVAADPGELLLHAVADVAGLAGIDRPRAIDAAAEGRGRRGRRGERRRRAA